MNYSPGPGTVAFRVLAHLQTLPHGTEVLTAALADAIRTDHKNIAPCMEQSLAAGLVFRRRRDSHRTSPLWWSLVDHSNTSAPGGSPAALGSIDDDEGNSGRARRLAGEGDSGGAGRTGLPGRAARGNGAAEHHAGRLRAQPSGAAHQGDAEHAGSDLNTSARDAGQCTDGEAAQAVHSGESGPGAASTPANGRPQARNGTPCRQDAGTSESPRVGAMGAGQPADAGPLTINEAAAWKEDTHRGMSGTSEIQPTKAGRWPAGPESAQAPDLEHIAGVAPGPLHPIRLALWSDGTLQIERKTVGGAAELVLLCRDETRELVRYLDSISLDSVREVAA